MPYYSNAWIKTTWLSIHFSQEGTGTAKTCSSEFSWECACKQGLALSFIEIIYPAWNIILIKVFFLFWPLLTYINTHSHKHIINLISSIIWNINGIIVSLLLISTQHLLMCNAHMHVHIHTLFKNKEGSWALFRLQRELKV